MNFYQTWQGNKSGAPCSLTVLPSAHQPQCLSGTSSPLSAPPPPPLLHDNGTGSSPGNGPFMSCVIKKMYSRLIARPLSSHLCFSAQPADERQRERVPVPTPSQIPHRLLFVRVSSSEYHWSCGATGWGAASSGSSVQTLDSFSSPTVSPRKKRWFESLETPDILMLCLSLANSPAIQPLFLIRHILVLEPRPLDNDMSEVFFYFFF